MAVPQQAVAFRAANIAIAGEVEKDLAKFWARMNLSKVDAATNALADFVPLLTRRYGDIAATVAADWYESLRGDAKVKGAKYRALAADPVAEEVSRQSVKSASVFLWTPDPDATLRALTGTVGRHVLQAGRDTITTNAVRDPKARGWQRVGSGKTCEWCQMMIGRGAVYTEASVSFEAHNRDQCGAEPVWS